MANKYASADTTPMSAYVLIVQALRNALNAIVTNVDWDELFGDGALDELVALNSIRFNLGGKKPCGTTKVGLLDEYHLWCFQADPFSRNFTHSLYIEHEAVVERNMIAFFLPLPEPTGTPENTAEIDRIVALRRKVMEDYLQFKT
jgi:hypothetical protein